MISTGVNPEAREAVVLALRQHLARNRLLDFTKYTMPEFQVNWHHILTCNKLDDLVTGKIQRLIITQPPRHGKSELASRRLPAYALGRYPTIPILACSYSADLANDMCRDVKTIMDSQEYLDLFPGSAIPPVGGRSANKARKAEMFQLLHNAGMYRCAGVGGGTTGKGMKLGIIDDPVKNPKEAYSPVSRKAVWDWYQQVFRTRRNMLGTKEPCSMLIMMTRWHTDDLIGRVFELEEKDQDIDKFEVLNLPAVKEAGGHPEDRRKPGEALWPDLADERELRQIERQSANTFAALYQGDPRRAIVAEWPPECFDSRIWFHDWPKLKDIRVCALDPSKGTGSKYSDYAALIKMGVGAKDGKYYIECDQWNNRDASQLTKEVVAANDAFRPTMFAIESVMFQELFERLVLDYCDRSGYDIPPIYTINQSVQKETRIKRLSGFVTQDKLRIKDTTGGRLLVQQLQEFPLSAHDDGPDALEMAFRLYTDGNYGMMDDGLGGNLLQSIGAL